MPKLHIDEVYPKDTIYPMIVNFQNGYTTENFQDQSCSLFEDESTGKKVVVTEIGDLLYAGGEVKEELGKTLILAKNRKTGKVRLIEVGVAELKPVLKVYNDASQLLETSNLELSRKFGSKKQKQQMEHREKLKVNVETVTEQMQNVTQAISEDKLDISAYNKSDSDDFYVPPIDRTADKVEDVYDIDKILTEDQYEKIYSELEEKDYTSDLIPYVKSIVASKKLSNRHTVLAVYASTLVKYSLTMMKEVTKKNYIACPHSSTLNDIIMSNFLTTNSGRRNRPMPYKDKSLCHAAVFIMLINNFKLSLESFCEDTKMTAATATNKIRVTGASIVGSGSKKIAQLKLPLSSKGVFRRKSARF